MSDTIDVGELHWMLDALQCIEVGLVILDQTYRVRVWNGFMEHHSGLSSSQAQGADLFELIPELPRRWLQRKIDSVLTLNAAVYSTWEQRPHLFRFKAVRSITSSAELMYQNITMLPLGSLDGGCNHVCIAVYDVTEQAIGQQGLERANQELALLSSTDGLTGLFNRAHWEQQLRREFKRYQRYGNETALVMLDIDHFKRINDGFGHQAGDEVIRALAATIKDAARETDIAGRYGGEEFAIILSDTSIDGAMTFCERLRVAVAMLGLEYDDQSINFTISLGVAPMDPRCETPERWIVRADQALYRAKEAGRDRVERYDKRD